MQSPANQPPPPRCAPRRAFPSRPLPAMGPASVACAAHLRVLSFLLALTAGATFRLAKLVCMPEAVFVRRAKRLLAPGFEEQAGGGRLRRSCSRCVLPTWKRQEGRITTLLSPPPTPEAPAVPGCRLLAIARRRCRAGGPQGGSWAA